MELLLRLHDRLALEGPPLVACSAAVNPVSAFCWVERHYLYFMGAGDF
jgi:hypothetical protein